MNKNNPINSVYLAALACVSLMTFINSFYEALIFAVVVVGVFLFAISIVSMIEKIADKHVKFLAFALICAALITLLKVAFKYVNIQLVVLVSNTIDMAIIPCLLIGVVPIYFEDSLSVKQYFVSALLIGVGLVVILLTFGLFTEVVGYGTILDKSIGFDGIEFFTMPYGKMMVIGLFAIPMNMVRRAYLKRVRKYQMLVEKYKIHIREIRSSAQRQKQDKKGGQ